MAGSNKALTEKGDGIETSGMKPSCESAIGPLARRNTLVEKATIAFIIICLVKHHPSQVNGVTNVPCLKRFFCQLGGFSTPPCVREVTHLGFRETVLKATV